MMRYELPQTLKCDRTSIAAKLSKANILWWDTAGAFKCRRPCRTQRRCFSRMVLGGFTSPFPFFLSSLVKGIEWDLFRPMAGESYIWFLDVLRSEKFCGWKASRIIKGTLVNRTQLHGRCIGNQPHSTSAHPNTVLQQVSEAWKVL